MTATRAGQEPGKPESRDTGGLWPWRQEDGTGATGRLKDMLAQYLPVLLFLGVATGIGLILLGLGFLIGRGGKYADKLGPYECGFEAFEDSRMKFDVRYYLVAILFIVFDLEIAFLFPWAVTLEDTGLVGLAAMGVFLAVLVVGFVYEWKKGALEWD